MNIENAVLPDSIDESDVVEIESSALGTAQRYDEDEVQWDDTGVREFNPQNGRWYDEHSATSKESTEVVGGIEVDCAYEDCDGRTSVVAKGDIKDSCPGCGASNMGRTQFSSSSKSRRSRHSRLADRTTNIYDDYAKEMDRLVEAGCGPTAAMDYIMCSIAEIPYEEWAEARRVQPKSVKENISRVAENLGEQVTYKTRG